SALGFLATNSINQGDNRVSTLVPLTAGPWKIRAAKPDLVWPGTANLYVSWLVLARGTSDHGKSWLDGHEVDAIDSNLAEAHEDAEPFALAANNAVCFKGIQFLGDGFKLDDSVAALLSAKYRDAGIIRPWLNGADITDSNELPLRYAIDF